MAFFYVFLVSLVHPYTSGFTPYTLSASRIMRAFPLILSCFAPWGAFPASDVCIVLLLLCRMPSDDFFPKNPVFLTFSHQNLHISKKMRTFAA
jgi:hypothetical protein